MSRFSISKDFEFSASHRLAGLPPSHQCARLHGHNYIVRVVLAADELTAVGFVLDYGELAELRHFLDVTLDHRHLNDAAEIGNPTAENLARYLVDWCVRYHPEWPVRAVGVSETPKTWAWCPR